MATFQELRASRPVRYQLARVVYRALWWPSCAVVIPFALIGALADWLSWTAFPAIARAAQPIWSWWHRLSRKAGHAVIGYTPPAGEE